MEFVSFFMFIAWNALLTNLTFGKGESQTANHFLSFDSLMSATLFYITPLFSFANTKRVKVTTISKDKVKNLNSKSTHDLNSFLKNKGYLTKMFYHFLFRKLDVRYKTTKNFVKNKLLRLKLLHPHFSSPINIKAWHYVMLNVPVLLGGNLIFLHREEAHSVFYRS